MAQFLTAVDLRCMGDKLWLLLDSLEYDSDILGKIVVPKGFYTDLASVPRVPIAYWLWGGRAHYEAIIHDYLFRTDSLPKCTWSQANKVFLEAMAARKKSVLIRYPMYWGVCFGSAAMWHIRPVAWEPT